MLEGDGIAAVKRAGRRAGSQAINSDEIAGCPRGSAGHRTAIAPWLDRSKHVCPVIGTFMSAWHEGLPDEDRAILVPLFATIIQTRATSRIEERRALMAADWLVRIYAPVWLNLAGLRAQARLLYDLPEITEIAQAFEMRAVLAQVSHQANAEALGVDEAGWIKASDDCWASAWAAAFDAARHGADDPAWISAAAASRAAAGLAARMATGSFKTALQASAAELVVKMARFGGQPGI